MNWKNIYLSNLKMRIKQLYNETNYDDLQFFESCFDEFHENGVIHIEKISGWVKTYRHQGDIFFIGINDGSCQRNIQAIFDVTKNLANDKEYTSKILEQLSVGASLECYGVIVKPPESSKELLELHITTILHSGIVKDRKTYILSKGRVKPEVMRQHQHLRFKANYFSSIMKIRSKALDAVREFFTHNDFYQIDPNVITVSDCEGAGEVFQIVAPSDKMNGGKSDFFDKPAYLTVSSQLQLEAACAGLGRCYTMNPSFRAEKSNTTRHMACFTHIEYEASFGGLDELMDLSENMVKYVIRKCIQECCEEYKFLDSFYSKHIIERLTHYISCPRFPRLSYNQALHILEQAIRDKKLKLKSKDIPKWGDDLGSTCEKYLAEEVYKVPLLVYNYPKKLKSFYMKEDECDQSVVNCMDMLVPHIGELIGSSVREDNCEKLLDNMKNKNIAREPLEWYVDLRRNGTWRHYGGGLGFERLVGLLTMDSQNFNVRDCSPFPVCYGECSY